MKLRHHRGIGMTSHRTRERLVQRLQSAGIADKRVLQAILTTPRHIFVDEALASRAYDDTALPIGFGQTISQPYTVARMTELAVDGPCRKVLEIGTGSGYQTAVLACLIKRVYSIERINSLLARARLKFRELGLNNVRLRHADGQTGWPESGPFDAILITAAAPVIPPELLEQLAEGGRLVAPVGVGEHQELIVLTRTPQGYRQAVLESVSFVPLLSGNN